MDSATLLAAVARIAPSLHKAGTFSARSLDAIVGHASGPIAHSAETGSGASTLLFSHLSAHHTVFALDDGTNSIRGVETSPLLRRDVVTFVEGPTQVTLPRHTFTDRLQLVLIDGPHGYPFPDLEYYYLYPHLDPGALLIVDDIHIPTITNLFEFLCADDMFALQEVVETTAFFRRTGSPTFSPTGDGWWEQRYNQRAFESTRPEPLREPFPARNDSATPCHLDQLGQVVDPQRSPRITVGRHEELTVAGWALDARARRPAAAVDLVLDGVPYRTTVRVPRGDVASAHRDHGYLRSGFSARFPPELMTPGWHEMEVRVVLTGEREYYPAVRLRFEVL